MKTKLIVCASFLTLLTAACDSGDKPADKPASSAKAATTAAASSKAGDTKEAKATEPKKLDKDGLESLADGVKFTQGDEKDGTFSGKLENSGENDIGRMEYKAFAYGDDDKLLEMVEGKFPKKLAAGASADIEVGPFTKTAGKTVAIEVVVSWMNVDGTSWQRPVPKDRAKGGPNNALKK